jgi:hypothetical protein
VQDNVALEVKLVDVLANLQPLLLVQTIKQFVFPPLGMQRPSTQPINVVQVNVQQGDWLAVELVRLTVLSPALLLNLLLHLNLLAPIQGKRQTLIMLMGVWGVVLAAFNSCLIQSRQEPIFPAKVLTR